MQTREMNAPSCIRAFVLLYGNERILVRAEPNFLAVLDGRLPAGIRCAACRWSWSCGSPCSAKALPGRIGWRLTASMHARSSATGSNRGEHAHIRHHRHIILLMAVAVRGDITRDGDMKAGSSVDNCLCVFCDLVVEHLNSLIVIRRDCVLGTRRRCTGRSRRTCRGQSGTFCP